VRRRARPPASASRQSTYETTAVALPRAAVSYVLCRDALAAVRSVRQCAAALAGGDTCDRWPVAGSGARPRASAARPSPPRVDPAPLVDAQGGAPGARRRPPVAAAAPASPPPPVVTGRRAGSRAVVATAAGGPGAAAPPRGRGEQPPPAGELLRVGVEGADDGTLSLLLPAAWLGLDGGVAGGGGPDGSLAEVICRVTDVRRFVPLAPEPAAVRLPRVFATDSQGW